MKMSQMNIYYPKFRKMYGHIVLLIIFGLLTAGESTDLFFEVTDK